MKKISVFLLMLISGFFSLNAQIYKYIEANEKVVDSNNVEVLPRGSVAKTELWVEIVEPFEKEKESNTAGKVVKGAHFQVITENERKEKIHFKDSSESDRYDCATLKLCYKLKTGAFIPKDDANISLLEETSINKDSAFLKTIIDKCEFDATTRTLYVNDDNIRIYLNGHFIDKSAQIPADMDEVLLYSLNSSENIPDYLLNISECKKKLSNPTYTDKQDTTTSNWFDDFRTDSPIIFWIVIAVVAIILVRFIKYLVRFIKYIKDYFLKKNNDDEDDFESNRNVKKHKVGVHKKYPSIQSFNDEKHIDVKGGNEGLSNLEDKVDKVIKNIKNIQDQLNVLNDIKQPVSKSNDKQTIQQLQNEVSDLKTKKQEVETNLKKYKEANALYDSEIKKLKAAAEISGAYVVTSANSLISFAQNIEKTCTEAESIVTKYWLQINNANKSRIQYFISKYWETRLNVPISKWNGIIACLDLNGYVKNSEYTKYLKDLSPEKRGEFLFQRYFEEIVRPYVSAVVLILEQLRSASKVGVTENCKGNLEGLINAICTRCNDMKITIDYQHLYEKVKDYGTLDIETELPKVLDSLLSNVKENEVLLSVEHYAVNSPLVEKKEKTSCVVLI